MSVVSRRVQAPPKAVFEVLADGWSYSSWVVGACRVRDVDASWPGRGSRIHHSVGVWPLLINDQTEVLDVELERRLVLQARGWPVGEAWVDITVEPVGDGTQVTLAEGIDRGPAQKLLAPLLEPALSVRNRESLCRLANIAMGRARCTGHSSATGH